MTKTVVHAPVNYTPMIIVAFVVVALVNSALVGWGYWMADQQGHVELIDLHVIGDTSLCPGELLVYDYTMKVTRSATINLSTTIERITPQLKDVNPVTFTSSQQFSVHNATTIKLRRNVYFGETYTDPATAKDTRWQPGEYRQRTIASVLGRSEFSEIEVPFTVRDSCGGKGFE